MLKIRKMRVADVPRLVRIIKSVLGPLDASKAAKDLRDQSKGLYVEGEDFVAEVDDKVVGVIGYWRLFHHPKHIAWMDWFAVEKKLQRRGIGTTLLDHLMRRLSEKKFKILICEKSTKDLSSSSFYTKHGFRKFGGLPDYWEDGGKLELLVKKVKK